MPKFRTATGLLDTTPYLRTANGLTACAPIFYGSAGPVQAGGAQAIAASASPDTVFGANSQRTTAPCYTNATTVQVTGGTPPYSYAWSVQTGWTVANPSGVSTAFHATVAPGDDKAGSFTCTVTDARGKVATSNTVSASVSNFGQPNAPLQ